MIDKDIVFQKSDSGKAEIAKPIAETLLPRELRSVLILIDGKKKYSLYEKALVNTRIVESHGSVDQCFDTLIDLGFIETMSESPGKNPPEQKAAQKIDSPPEKTNSRLAKPSAAPLDTQDDELAFSLPEGKDDLELANLRSGVIECIERDLGASSWEVLLDLERAQSVSELIQAIEQLVKTHKQAFSGDSKRALNDIYKKLKKLRG